MEDHEEDDQLALALTNSGWTSEGGERRESIIGASENRQEPPTDCEPAPDLTDGNLPPYIPPPAPAVVTGASSISRVGSYSPRSARSFPNHR